MPELNQVFSPLPFYGFNAGNASERGIYVSPGSRVILLCNSTGRAGDDPAVTARFYGGTQGTLSSALALCRANMGDTILVLPGHAENVGTNDMANLVAGTRIIGVSTGDPKQSTAPTFTWNATGSTWAINKANVEISGLRLLMDGANGVVKAINITAAGCRLSGNFMRWSSSAALLATIAIEVGSAATDTTIFGNYIQGDAAGLVTDGIKLVGATTPDRTTISNNTIIAAANVNNGFIHVTVAALNLLIHGNIMYNVGANSVACIALDNVALDGVASYNMMGVKSAAGAPAAEGIVSGGASVLLVAFENRCVTAKFTTGIVSPANDA